jgi:hypothetical protein
MMNTFKSKIFWTIGLLFSHIVVFTIGAVIARNMALKVIVTEVEKADAHLLIGHYTGYRDIALDLIGGNSEKAKCLAELSASAMFDSLKTCVGNAECLNAIERNLRVDAPEVLGEAPLKFDYLKSKNGIKICQ